MGTFDDSGKFRATVPRIDWVAKVPRIDWGNVFSPPIILTLDNVDYTTALMHWTDVSRNGIGPVQYRIYRAPGLNAHSGFALIDTVGPVFTYLDTGLEPAAHDYTWYVQGVYISTNTTSPSNTVWGTTLKLSVLYSLLSNGIDVYDVTDQTAPFFASHTTPAIGATTDEGSVADPYYVWIGNGVEIFTFQWRADQNHPALKSDLWYRLNMIVRRGMATRNNLLFTLEGSGQDIASYNISDPEAPVLINKQAWSSFGMLFYGTASKFSMAYDAVGNRLFWNAFIGGGGNDLLAADVAADGTLGAPYFVWHINAFLSSYQSAGGFIYNNEYWVQRGGGANYVSYKLDGTGAGSGATDSLPGGLIWNGTVPRVKGHHVFLGAGQPDVSHEAVCIMNLATGHLVAQFGGPSVRCNGLLLSGNSLFFAIGTTLYIYDITQTLLSDAVPTLLGQVTGPNVFTGIAGYYADGWDGNNGGCAT